MNHWCVDGLTHPCINDHASLTLSLQVRPDGIWEEHRRTPKQRRSEIAARSNKATTHGNHVRKAEQQGSFESRSHRRGLPTGTQFTLEGMRGTGASNAIHTPHVFKHS